MLSPLEKQSIYRFTVGIIIYMIIYFIAVMCGYSKYTYIYVDHECQPLLYNSHN